MYTALVGLDREGNPVPELAERWEVRNDARTQVFYLRKGIFWLDGKPFTAEDVKYTFDEVLLKYHARTKAGLEAAPPSIETPDPQQVIFRFKFPYAPLLRRLDVTEAPILPRHLYQGTNPLTNPYNQRPVGTGPFRFAEWRRGSQVILVKNPNYFKPGLPRLERLVFRFLPDPTAASIALERGEVDYLWSVPGASLSRLRSLPNVRLERHPAGPGGSYCIDTLVPNLQHPILRNRKVRQAFYQAINRDFLLERVYFGQGRLARGPIASTLPFFDPTLPLYLYNPEEANRLLDGAGYPRRVGGARFALRFTFAQPNFTLLSEVLKDNFRQVGMASGNRRLPGLQRSAQGAPGLERESF